MRLGCILNRLGGILCMCMRMCVRMCMCICMCMCTYVCVSKIHPKSIQNRTQNHEKSSLNRAQVDLGTFFASELRFSSILDASWRVPGAVLSRLGRQDERSWQPRGTQWRVLAAKMCQVGSQEAPQINKKSIEKSIEIQMLDFIDFSWIFMSKMEPSWH